MKVGGDEAVQSLYRKNNARWCNVVDRMQAGSVTSSSRSELSKLLLVIAVILLGQTLFWATKVFSWAPLLCATAAMLMIAVALCVRPDKVAVSQFSKSSSVAYRWTIVAGVAVGFVQLPLVADFYRVPSFRPLVMPFIEMAVLAAALAAVVLFARRRGLVLASFVILLVLHALMGLWYLRLSADPHIDVFLIQRLGCDALLHGHNPYAITFPDIYGPKSLYYPPGTVVNGVVQCGYFYPPLSLVMDVPGFLFGDVRYSHWAALTINFALLAFGMPRRRGVPIDLAPVVLLMFLPGLFHLIENAWIDPLLLLMMTLAVIASLRQRWIWAAIATGLLLSGKQYAVLVTPAALLLVARPWSTRNVARWAAVVAAVGLAITLPFLLWNPQAFFHSLISIDVGILRSESITYLPILSRLIGRRLSLTVTLMATVPATAMVLWRAPRSAEGFAVGTSFIWIVTFLFSTQAFGNYYFLVAGTLCVALAARGHSRAGDGSSQRSASAAV